MAERGTLPAGDAALPPRPSWRAVQRHGWPAALAALGAAAWLAMARWPADASLLVAAFAPATLMAPAPGPLLLQARERGLLRVGVREYPRPSLPSDPLPPEPDSYDAGLARHIAGQLGVKVQLVGLAPRKWPQPRQRARWTWCWRAARPARHSARPPSAARCRM
ncbi:MAG TPA: hypothetical protein PKM82_13485 [Acidovorax sp.]|nr:hypothetical protein [Acidovorax sp.]